MGSPTDNAVDNNVMLLVTALVCAALAALFLFVNKSFAETAPVAETPDTAATEEEVPENHKETKKKKKGALGLLKKNRQNQQAIQEQAANVEATNNNNDATNDDNDLADLTYDGDDFDELETAARGKVGAKKTNET